MYADQYYEIVKLALVGVYLGCLPLGTGRAAPRGRRGLRAKHESQNVQVLHKPSKAERHKHAHQHT